MVCLQMIHSHDHDLDYDDPDGDDEDEHGLDDVVGGGR